MFRRPITNAIFGAFCFLSLTQPALLAGERAHDGDEDARAFQQLMKALEERASDEIRFFSDDGNFTLNGGELAEQIRDDCERHDDDGVVRSEIRFTAKPENKSVKRYALECRKAIPPTVLLIDRSRYADRRLTQSYELVFAGSGELLEARHASLLIEFARAAASNGESVDLEARLGEAREPPVEQAIKAFMKISLGTAISVMAVQELYPRQADKIQHAVAGSIISGLTATLASRFLETEHDSKMRKALNRLASSALGFVTASAVGFLGATTAGTMKEWRDSWGDGHAEKADVYATMIGGGFTSITFLISF